MTVKKVTEQNIRQLAAWQPKAERTEEIPFTVARIVLQDFTGVPLLVDLAAMRSAAQDWEKTQRSSSRWCRWTWWSITRCRWILLVGGCDGQKLDMEFTRTASATISQMGHAGI
ncbi:MAG: hypothetical protein Ct9H300mP32_5010 [Verrucomicrobiota bacterium]|nr:MAG: hypothetical protein Ct9H300mP32_5010 [Verrucomicrobiota bacterium]